VFAKEDRDFTWSAWLGINHLVQVDDNPSEASALMALDDEMKRILEVYTPNYGED